MATYTELYGLSSDGNLLNRLTVAVVIKSQTLLDKSPPSAGEVAWATNTLRTPATAAQLTLRYVLAKNAAATVAQINAATDATIQGLVNAAVDAMIAGGITQ